MPQSLGQENDRSEHFAAANKSKKSSIFIRYPPPPHPSLPSWSVIDNALLFNDLPPSRLIKNRIHDGGARGCPRGWRRINIFKIKMKHFYYPSIASAAPSNSTLVLISYIYLLRFFFVWLAAFRVLFASPQLKMLFQ